MKDGSARHGSAGGRLELRRWRAGAGSAVRCGIGRREDKADGAEGAMQEVAEAAEHGADWRMEGRDRGDDASDEALGEVGGEVWRGPAGGPASVTT